MIRTKNTWAGALSALLVLTLQQGFAQTPNPYMRQPSSGYVPPPLLSPYLNLGRGGSPSANLYFGVFPFESRGWDNPRSPGSIIDWERRLGPAADLEDLMPTLAGTGHPAGFMTTIPYYGSSLGNYTSTPRYNPGGLYGGFNGSYGSFGAIRR